MRRHLKKKKGSCSDSVVKEIGRCDAEKKLRIFLSYGHDEYTAIANRMKNDLECRGHEVWFDADKLKAGKVWEEYIEQGIDWVSEQPDKGRIVLLMTPHSVRRPNGFCLNELARALDRQLRVVPVMVVEVEPPLSICRVQWLDLQDCLPVKKRRKRYVYKFEQLVDALENDALDFEGIHCSVRAVLHPLCYRADIAHHLPRFTGREWLFDRFRQWMQDPNGGRVFWITGDPGVGKTAIASMLCAKFPEVGAFHVCRYCDEEKCDPKRAVQSIAYQLSTQLPGLLEKLNAIANLEEVCESPSVSTIFERLIVGPLHSGVRPPHKPVLILIDGLDEATRNKTNEFVEFLAEEMDRPPAWLRFVLTSRPEAEVVQPLQAYTPVHIASDSNENKDDIITYLKKQFDVFEPDPEKLDQAITAITAQSEFLFLYVEEMRKALEEQRFDMDHLEEIPKGIDGFYYKSFKRKFVDSNRYKEIHGPALKVVVAACAPLPVVVLTKIFKWSPDEVDEVLEEWGAFFSVRDDRIRPFHRSLVDWLTTKNKAGSRFYVDPSTGHNRLAEVGWIEYQQGVKNMSEYFQAHLPEHLERAGETEKLHACVTDCEFICCFSMTGRLYELSRYWKDIENSVLVQMCRDSWERERAADKSFILLASRCLGRLFQHRGDYQTALFYFDKELELAESSGNDNDRAEAIYNIAWCFRHIDAFDEAITQAEKAREIFARTGKKSSVAKCLSVKGMCHWHKQEDAAAIEELRQALNVLQETGDVHSQAEVSNHLGIVYRSLGNYQQALEFLKAARQKYRKLNDRKGLGKCLNSIGTCWWWAGDLAKALASYTEANQINAEIDNQYVLGLTANNLGYVYLEKQDLEEARQQFAKALKIRENLAIESYAMMDLSGLALVAFSMGDTHDAKKRSAKALDVLAKYDTVEDLRRAYYNHYIIMKDGDAKEREAAAQALAKAKSLVDDRLKRIDDVKIRESLIGNVPLMKEILDIEISAPDGAERADKESKLKKNGPQ